MNKGSCNDLLEFRNWLHHTYVHLQSNILCVYATYVPVDRTESSILLVTCRPEHAVQHTNISFTSIVHDLKSIVVSSDPFLNPGCDISAFCED